jgi:hypothetical protein
VSQSEVCNIAQTIGRVPGSSAHRRDGGSSDSTARMQDARSPNEALRNTDRSQIFIYSTNPKLPGGQVTARLRSPGLNLARTTRKSTIVGRPILPQL